jgi:hypothetical protein
MSNIANKNMNVTMKDSSMKDSSMKDSSMKDMKDLLTFVGKKNLMEEEFTPFQSKNDKKKQKEEKKVLETPFVLGQFRYMKNRALCCSFERGFKECRFPVCDRAHSLDELVEPSKCDFDLGCRLVHMVNGVLLNKNLDKICPRIHSNEDSDNVLSRRGLNKFKGISIIRKPKEIVKKLEKVEVKKVEVVKEDVKKEIEKVEIKKVEVVKKDVKKFVPSKPSTSVWKTQPVNIVKIEHEDFPKPLVEDIKVKKEHTKKTQPANIESNVKPEVPTPVNLPKEMSMEVLKMLISSGKSVKITFT